MSFTSSLTFVKKQIENDDIYTFYFSTKKKLKHKAGQHGIFLLLGLYRPHPFTLSNSPDEEHIAFSTHTNTDSRYKQKLMQIKPGDKVRLLGPIQNFTLIDGESKYVFLAQGIGITPFRSLLAYSHTQELPVTTTLIHIDKKVHTFRKLTEQYATSSHYSTSREKFRELVQQQDPDQVFYISGTPRFISATKQLLRDIDVKSSNVRVDSFLGY